MFTGYCSRTIIGCLIYTDISKYIYAPTAELPQGSGCPVCVGTTSVGQASLVLGQPEFHHHDEPIYHPVRLP